MQLFNGISLPLLANIFISTRGAELLIFASPLRFLLSNGARIEYAGFDGVGDAAEKCKLGWSSDLK